MGKLALYRAQSNAYNQCMTKDELKLAKARFQSQRCEARTKRNIEWTLTFEEWLNIWLDSGHWHERGPRRGQYCMSRFGDKGPYSIDNVFIQLHSNNIKEGHLGKPKGPRSKEAIEKMMATRRAKEKAAEAASFVHQTNLKIRMKNRPMHSSVGRIRLDVEHQR